MRIKTRMQQLTLDRQYTGGPLPYGYKLVKTSRVNRKGYEIHDLAVEPMEAEQKIESLKEDENDNKVAMEKIMPAFNQFKSWAEGFETATLEQKKVIACQLFKRIEVGREYKINFEMNLNYSEFCTEWNTVEELMSQAG